MYYANTNLGKIAAEHGIAGTCPLCGGIVIPKCGSINVHHWAHKNLEECDSWAEGETDWHLQWKSYFPPECAEVTEIRDGIKHRADVKLSTGWTFEFQNSPISSEEIQERNEFWGKVIWVFKMSSDAQTTYPKLNQWASFSWERIANIDEDGENYDAFIWKHAKRSLEGLDKFVLDFGSTVFVVDSINFSVSPTEGGGNYMNKFYFLNHKLNIIDEWKKVGITKTFDWRTLKFSEPAL